MDWNCFKKIDLSEVQTPIHIIDSVLLKKNIDTIDHIQKESSATILLALKAFAQFSVFEIINKQIKGCTSSSLNELMLADEKFGGELHFCAPAIPVQDIQKISELASHIVFNSFYQLDYFLNNYSPKKTMSLGIRINPEHTEGKVALYDPCAPGSRLGVKLDSFNQNFASYKKHIKGIHFHTLCETGFEPLARTLAAVEENFGFAFADLEWINFGGGHLLSSPDYNRPALISLIKDFQKKYKLKVYLEPGEAFVRNTGVLVARILDIIPGEIPVAILDCSAAAHMPDVLEMPYRPDVLGAGQINEHAYNIKLAGLTCLAGDIIGDYSFPQKPAVGDLVYFLDMSHYTMVKNTNFNGVPTPSIAISNHETSALQFVKKFGYADYKSRLS